MNRTLLFGVASLLVANIASAAWTVAAGDHLLLPDTPGQTINILISGERADGADLAVIIGDGGSELGGTDVAPMFTDADLIGPGTLFDNNNTGQFGGVAAPLAVFSFTTTADGFVDPVDAPGASILAYLTIDTTGFNTFGQSWALSLSNDELGETVIATDASGTTLVPGSITIIPEPASMLLLAMGGLFLRRRRA